MHILNALILIWSIVTWSTSYAASVGGGGGGGTTIQTGTVTPSVCTPGASNALFLDTDDETLYFCGSTDTFVQVNPSEADTIQTVFGRGNIISTAISFATALKLLDSNGDGYAWYVDPTNGPTFVCVDNFVEGACSSYTRTLASGQTLVYKNSGGTAIFTLTNDTDTLTVSKLKVTKDNAILVPLNPRGAATSALESIVTNQPKDYYLTVTDANTDAADFSYIVPSTSGLIGATTATFTLTGVSKNASPSGNIDLDCAISAFAPGSETLTAHVTTGEVTALLTPATQNREVVVTTSAHTINGGALAARDKLHGSCEVDATATTSAQMSDFRLWGWVLITFN